ncbi:hypothetical protein [Saccharothrix longispora]|uniref:hypothetical protein n=1 Tax=Saccharothrix longispora TaxID=33920 RepID=UPI0028FD6C54|nr:hypothetical protein [Saccharothrix longispora]MDU0293817.1 hypothetical protein [Saccharothrix longispora]
MSGKAERAGEKLDSLEVIQRWSEVSPEHLKSAIKALDSELSRAHELRMVKEQHQEAKARREHTLYMTSMLVGSLVIIALLSGAVLLATRGQVLLPTIFTTLSVTMATVFVLRKHDPQQMRAVIKAQERITRSLSASADPAAAIEGTIPPTR